MGTPDVPRVLQRIVAPGLEFRPLDTTYFVGRETVLTGGRSGIAPWRKRLFAGMSHNALAATSYVNLPPPRVVELGSQIEI
jgi:KUP system potassium uptake protein